VVVRDRIAHGATRTVTATALSLTGRRKDGPAVKRGAASQFLSRVPPLGRSEDGRHTQPADGGTT